MVCVWVGERVKTDLQRRERRKWIQALHFLLMNYKEFSIRKAFLIYWLQRGAAENLPRSSSDVKTSGSLECVWLRVAERDSAKVPLNMRMAFAELIAQTAVALYACGLWEGGESLQCETSYLAKLGEPLQCHLLQGLRHRNDKGGKLPQWPIMVLGWCCLDFGSALELQRFTLCCWFHTITSIFRHTGALLVHHKT